MSEVNLSAVTTEALNKSDVLWVRAQGRDRATWFAPGERELAGRVLLVSGGPEADLGPLPEQVEIVLRSKADGGRLLTLRARVHELEPGNPLWEPAAALLRAERLNAPADIIETWRSRSTLWALSPFGAPLQAPGQPGPQGSERAEAPVSPGAAGRRPRRPWHLGGRKRRGRPGTRG